jgi:hypothetical protein
MLNNFIKYKLKNYTAFIFQQFSQMSTSTPSIHRHHYTGKLRLLTVNDVYTSSAIDGKKNI